MDLDTRFSKLEAIDPRFYKANVELMDQFMVFETNGITVVFMPKLASTRYVFRTNMLAKNFSYDYDTKTLFLKLDYTAEGKPELTEGYDKLIGHLINSELPELLRDGKENGLNIHHLPHLNNHIVVAKYNNYKVIYNTTNRFTINLL